MIETLRTVPVDIKHCDFRVRIIVSHCTGVGFLVGNLRIILRTHSVTLRSIHIVSSSQDTEGVTLALIVPLSVCVQSLRVDRTFNTKEERANVFPNFYVFATKTGIRTSFPLFRDRGLRSHQARASAPLP